MGVERPSYGCGALRCATITDSRRSHISNQLNDSTDSHQRWRVVRELLHSVKAKLVGPLIDNDALCASFSTFFCNKISSLKSVIASQIASLPPPPPDPICHHPTMQLLEPVTASEVFRMLLSIPSKTSVLDFVPIPRQSNHARLSSLILRTSLFPKGSFHQNSSMPPSRPFSRNQILIHPNPPTIVQFLTSTIFRRSLNAYSWLVSSPTSSVHPTSTHCNPHTGATTQPRHPLFTSWTLSIIMLMMVWQLYLFLLISVQPLILSIILSSSSASLIASVSWAQLTTGSTRICLVGLTLCE